ncbi:unnamed protein product, partial [marine sediment metagenome]
PGISTAYALANAPSQGVSNKGFQTSGFNRKKRNIWLSINENH